MIGLLGRIGEGRVIPDRTGEIGSFDPILDDVTGDVVFDRGIE